MKSWPDWCEETLAFADTSELPMATQVSLIVTFEM